jgi:hypothetical protein
LSLMSGEQVRLLKGAHALQPCRSHRKKLV